MSVGKVEEKEEGEGNHNIERESGSNDITRLPHIEQRSNVELNN